MSSWITNNFDIDLWIKLAADHPFKFEQQRQQWLEHSIQSASEDLKPRLKGLQWEMNMDLELARNKFRQCRYLSERLVDNLRLFKEILAGKPQIFLFKTPATILEFAPRD